MLCALLVAGACTGGGDGDGDGDRDKGSRSTAQPEKLRKAWETSIAPSDDAGGTVWTGHGVLVRQDGGQLRAYDARSGEKRWTLKAPEGTSGVCGMSEKPNGAGLGGLFFTERKRGGQDRCSYAGAVDLADGKVRWAKRVGPRKGSGAPDISIGDEALTVTLECYGVKQFRARDGKSLGTRLKSDKACAHDVDHNGRHLAVREAPVGKAKERVPGWIPAAEGPPAHFALYEGADPEPVWRTKVDRVGDHLFRIVSDDPLVLSVSEEGHNLLRTYGPDGEPVRTIGKELGGPSSAPAGDGWSGPYVRGNTLVKSYDRDPALYAYDLRTGKVRWKKHKDGARVLGVHRGRLLALRQTKSPKGMPVPVLVTFGMRDGAERTVGRITETGVHTRLWVAWDDDRIYLHRAGRAGKASIVAYPLPRSGGEKRRYAAEPVPWDGATPLRKRGWREGDLRPDEVATACEAVSPTARKALRVYRKGMPPPEDCSWEERYAPSHAERRLDVTVTAHQPGGDGEPAVSVARKAFRSAGEEKNGDGGDGGDDGAFAGAHRLKGLGDEAKSLAHGSVRDSASGARILVRHRNVTVRVTARTEALEDGLRGEVPPRHRVEAAARVAAADVLKRLGADVPGSARRLADPAGGGTSEAEPVCARLRSEAARLAPGAEALDTTPKGGADGRVTGCVWESGDDLSPSLSVRVKAVPDSPLTGESAAELAGDAVTPEDGAEMRGLGDEARIERDSFTFRRTGNMNRRHTLTVREGNLVVTVEHQRWHHPPKSRLDTDVRRVARRVLSAYE
ncbi:hypothetical protein GCM10009801_18750 [Streptomyces albiaxialis]|uniref:Pyrrolo-quinoline quinone repeat domain-containing protein n=1 Tax=Streptomyces albiaxialis TaxID=329523 RepID=A0ABN2VS98_9ACTN